MNPLNYWRELCSKNHKNSYTYKDKRVIYLKEYKTERKISLTNLTFYYSNI